MNIYVWRHNKTYHSHSMIEEPCINSEFYLDAIAIVVASTMDEAVELLAAQNKGWWPDDLLALTCTVYPADRAGVIFTELRGAIQHL